MPPERRRNIPRTEPRLPGEGKQRPGGLRSGATRRLRRLGSPPPAPVGEALDRRPADPDAPILNRCRQTRINNRPSSASLTLPVADAARGGRDPDETGGGGGGGCFNKAGSAGNICGNPSEASAARLRRRRAREDLPISNGVPTFPTSAQPRPSLSPPLRLAAGLLLLAR